MQTRSFVLGLVLLIFGLPLFGQTFGEITGTVADPTGAAIAGAIVTVTNVNTNAVRTAVSTDAGIYTFPSLAPGLYKIRVEKTGFKSDTASNVDVQVQQSLRLD